jgi:8-oxo-dGTP pyrophosphatase MutT (NUDIX family)/RimJ/RimL family protein N-acetyltransferase
MSKAIPCQSFKEPPSDFHPKLETAACYCIFQGRQLLLHRHPSRSQGLTWGTVAGKLEKGETALEAIVRELHEEAHIDVNPEELTSLGKLYLRHHDLDYIYHLFTKEFAVKPSVKLNDEHIDFGWFTLSEMLDLPLIGGGGEAMLHFRKNSNRLLPEKITFRLAKASDLERVHAWWNKPHVKEHWDNSPEMWANCDDFIKKGIKAEFDYWIASFEGYPYALIMTSDTSQPCFDGSPYPEIYTPWLDPKGKTYTLDFMIGDERFLGLGLSHLTLRAFMDSLKDQVAAFLIDPAATNPRAVHIYEKAGFVKVAEFTRSNGFFEGIPHVMLKYETRAPN